MNKVLGFIKNHKSEILGVLALGLSLLTTCVEDKNNDIKMKEAINDALTERLGEGK